MSRAAAITASVEPIENSEWSPESLDVFRLRAWARAYLWAACMFGLHEAVDVLHADAAQGGLVDQIGADRVQKIIAQEFKGACHA